jgi:ABC-type Fe3+ transport system substrate-binding protein
VIVSEPAMDVLDRDGIVNPESRVRLAKVGVTTYEGGLMTDGAVPQAARAFIRFLAEPEARAAWLAARLEPLGDQ